MKPVLDYYRSDPPAALSDAHKRAIEFLSLWFAGFIFGGFAVAVLALLLR